MNVLFSFMLFSCIFWWHSFSNVLFPSATSLGGRLKGKLHRKAQINKNKREREREQTDRSSILFVSIQFCLLCCVWRRAMKERGHCSFLFIQVIHIQRYYKMHYLAGQFKSYQFAVLVYSEFINCLCFVLGKFVQDILSCFPSLIQHRKQASHQQGNICILISK